MTTKQVQCLLCYLGYDPGDIDGVSGKNTIAAVKRFQADYGLTPDGDAGAATQKMLTGAVAGTAVKVEKPVDAAEGSGKETTAGTGTFWAEIKYFKRSEFRCPCGKWCNGFPVEPKEGLVRFMDEMRGHFGRGVIVVPPDGHSGGSGVRCDKYNASLPGSVANSTHKEGRAADFSIPGITDAAIAEYLTAAKANGKIAYWYKISSGSFHVNI